MPCLFSNLSKTDRLVHVKLQIDKWNFHHTCGAVDGKHVAIKCPPNGGTLYFNYKKLKKFYSIGLLALVDANYRFLYVSLV